MNAASLPGRVIPGYIAVIVGPFNILALSMLFAAVVIYAGMALSSGSGVFAWAACYGFVNGALVSLQGACVGQVCKDFRTMGTMLGMSSAVGSIATLTGTPIAGAILTAENGVFNGALIFGGTVLLGGFALIMAVKLIHGHGNLFVVF